MIGIDKHFFLNPPEWDLVEFGWGYQRRSYIGDVSFDRAWLEGFLSILADFQQEHGVPVAVNEFGVTRWVPNAADFMRDEMDIFEGMGINHAL